MHIFDLIILIAGFSGFAVALYIAVRKMKKKPLVCPLRSNCNEVVTSDFSKFLGMHIEYLGIAYYSFVVVSRAVMLAVPAAATPFMSLLSMVLSSAAFLFSIYLIFVQVFRLKSWCTWCLVSALLSISIFIFTVLQY